MCKIFKHRKLPCIPCLGETHIKLQWYNIFPQLFFLFLILQHNFFRLRLRHQTSATKLRYWRSSAFYRQPKYYLYHNVSGLYYMSSCWINELCMRLNLQFIVIWHIEYSIFSFQHLIIDNNSHRSLLLVTVDSIWIRSEEA